MAGRRRRGSSSAGQRHSGGASSSSGGSSSSSSSSSAAAPTTPPCPGPTPSGAIPARARARATATHNGRNSYYYGSPYYYGRQYYYNAYDPFFYGAYGYSPFYYSGAYGYAPYYYGGRYSDGGSLRVIVDPEQTRVYVDGYYAGIVDDFDGIFQRLSLPPGRHEISLKLDGYRTHKFRVYVPVDQTLKLHHVMERGPGEDTERGDRRAERRRDDDRDRDEGDRRDDRRRARPRRTSGRTSGTTRKRPPCASTSGRPTPPCTSTGSSAGSGRRVENLRLAPGRHRLEVVRPGYRTVEREIEVRAGETTAWRSSWSAEAISGGALTQIATGGARNPRRPPALRAAGLTDRLLLPAADGERRGGGLVEVLVDAAGHGGGDVAAARPHEHHHHDFGAIGGGVGREPAHAGARPRLPGHDHVRIERAGGAALR